MYGYRKLNQAQRIAVLQERDQFGFPRHAPPHPVAGENILLLSAACYEHQAYINTGQRQLEVWEKFQQLAEQFELTCYAWVVLPNHYHVLAHVSQAQNLGSFFQRLHGGLSFEWNQADAQQGRKVWYRYSDRIIRSERHYYVSLNYIHYNPVKHGYVQSPYDWPVSSVHWYLEHKGREWLRDLWQQYPVLDYGKDWDK
jgi:putative transposase